jgi:flagellar basal body-associated protein FliL
MSASIETQWQSQRERRRRLFRIILILCVIIAAVGVIVWFWTTQPLFSWSPSGHTANDTAEKLDYRRMAMVVAGVYGAVIDLSR